MFSPIFYYQLILNRSSIVSLNFVWLSLAIHMSSVLHSPVWPMSLDNHLCNSLPTKRLASHKTLPFHSRQSIEHSSEGQHYRCSNQTRRVLNYAKPLDEAHDKVNAGTHVVRSEAAHEGIEFRGRRTDTKEQRNLDEDDDD